MGNLMATAAVERGMAGMVLAARFAICGRPANGPDRRRAVQVAAHGRAIDDRECAMHPFIRRFKSLQAVIATFNWI